LENRIRRAAEPHTVLICGIRRKNEQSAVFASQIPPF
jgi:hypothetical protein